MALELTKQSNNKIKKIYEKDDSAAIDYLCI